MLNINDRLTVILCSLILIIGLANLESEASSSQNYQLEGGITAAGGWSSGSTTDLFSSFGPSQPTGHSESTNYTIDSGIILPEIEEVKWGDVSFDGFVTAYDASLIFQHVIGLISLPEDSLEVADVNHDSQVTVLDAKLILKFIIGLNDSLD
jgi:hypothetical protein